MTTENQNAKMRAGDAKVLNFTITDAAQRAGFDLTVDHTVRWFLLNEEADPIAKPAVVEVTKSTPAGSGITVTGAAAFTVQLEEADTLTLTAGVYFQVAEIIDTGVSPSRPLTVALGEIEIEGNRTTATP